MSEQGERILTFCDSKAFLRSVEKRRSMFTSRICSLLNEIYGLNKICILLWLKIYVGITCNKNVYKMTRGEKLQQKNQCLRYTIARKCCGEFQIEKTSILINHQLHDVNKDHFKTKTIDNLRTFHRNIQKIISNVFINKANEIFFKEFLDRLKVYSQDT